MAITTMNTTLVAWKVGKDGVVAVKVLRQATPEQEKEMRQAYTRPEYEVQPFYSSGKEDWPGDKVKEGTIYPLGYDPFDDSTD